MNTLLLLAAAASQVGAATIRIDVGRGLVFTPSSVTAAVGDVLEYHFLGGTHDVARGDFGNACKPAAAGGFYSGVFSPKNGEAPDVFRVTVTSTDPIFYYCSVAGHCSGGMVGVVNPSGGQSLDAYKSAAEAATEEAPPAPFGGVLGPPPSNSGPAPAAPAPAPGPDSGSGPGPASEAPTGAAPGAPAGTAAPSPTGAVATSPSGSARSSATGSTARSSTSSAARSLTSSTGPAQSTAATGSGVAGSSAAGAPTVAKTVLVGMLGIMALALWAV